jgi:hypothetical protein
MLCVVFKLQIEGVLVLIGDTTPKQVVTLNLSYFPYDCFVVHLACLGH